MIHIEKLRGGKLAVTYGRITYLYEDLPAEARYALARELRKIYLEYLIEYNKLRGGFCEMVSEKKIIAKI